ncbi:MAG: SCO family protein [Acidobacteriota bacterium]
MSESTSEPTVTTPEATEESAPKRSGFWLSPAFWVLGIGLIFTLPMVRAITSDIPGPLPVLGEVPEFQLIDQTGRPFGSEELRGRVWVGSLIFTRCPTICPALMGELYEIQHRSRGLGEAFKIVSITVDPEHDTPEVLAASAAQYKASSRVWIFLTGEHDAIMKLAVEGLKMSMGAEGDRSDPMNVFHSGSFVLVDQSGQIRGFYDPMEEGKLDDLLRDAGLLVNRNPSLTTPAPRPDA